MSDPDIVSIRSHDRFKAALARIPKAEPEAEMEEEEEDPFVTRHIVRTTTLGTYLVYFPKNYNELERKEKASLQICVILHGHGSTEMGHGDLSNDLGRDKAIYVVPRAPYFDTGDSLASSTEGYTLHPPHLPDVRSQTMHPFVLFADFVRTCVDDTRTAYRLDKDKKIRVLGHSMGAAAALVFACRYSDMVDSAFIYAGHLPGPGLEMFRDPSALGPRFDGGGIEKAKHVKFVVAHCKDDDVLDISESEAIIARLAESGITAEAKFLETGGHSFPPELIAILTEWIKTSAAEAKAADGK
jgi:predicted esterase